MKSILQADHKCFLCDRNGSADRLEWHHVFFGSNRRFSEEDGMKILLCGERCHRNGKMSVHKNSDIDQAVKKIAQTAWEACYGSRQAFAKRYGKNYL